MPNKYAVTIGSPFGVMTVVFDRGEWEILQDLAEYTGEEAESIVVDVITERIHMAMVTQEFPPLGFVPSDQMQHPGFTAWEDVPEDSSIDSWMEYFQNRMMNPEDYEDDRDEDYGLE